MPAVPRNTGRGSHAAATPRHAPHATPATAGRPRHGSAPRRIGVNWRWAISGAAATLLTGSVALTAGNPQLPASATAASAVRLTDAADTYVSEAATHKNFGAASRIAASNRPDSRSTGYLRFALPAGAAASVRSATLVLTRDEHHLSGAVDLHAVADAAWAEQSLTASSAPPIGALLASVQTSRSTDTVSFDVTAALRAGNAASFALVSQASNDVVRFRSREAGSGQPMLVLDLGNGAGASPTSSAPVASPSKKPAPSSTAPGRSSAPATSTAAAPTGTSKAAPTGSATATTAPAAPTGGFARPGCTVSAKLVPSCGRWWGVAPRAFTKIPLVTALTQAESTIGRPFDIVHNYHTNDSLFPNAAERSLALQPGRNRLLLLNWKPATDMSWRDVANGRADARIDREAAYLKSSFDMPFFLNIWHEPENDVKPAAGSGMTAADYAAMYRHVVLRMRADGATKFVSVLTYEGYVPWAQTSWFSQLWAGSDVVDWVAIDPYASGDKTGYMSGNFNTLVNRPGAGFPGFYSYLSQMHPSTPMMVAEWGVKEGASNPGGKAAFFDSVSANIAKYPNLKALVYFDTPMPPQVQIGDTRLDSTAGSLAAFRRIGLNPALIGPALHYSGGAVVPGA